MLTAEIIGRLLEDARVETRAGREWVVLEVRHSENGEAVRVTCLLAPNAWSRGLMPSLRRGVKVYAAGFYRDSLSNDGGEWRVERVMRTTTVNVVAPEAS